MGQQLGQNTFIKNALKYGFSFWGLPKTGQTVQHRAGDDGDLEIGYPKAPPRFKDNGDGTITDNATGLMWVKDPTLDTKNWNDAIDYCLALDYADHDDWRLPNINELFSLIDWRRKVPSIDIIFFPNTLSAVYHSSTTYSDNALYSWNVSFVTGGSYYILKTTVKYLRPVRLGAPA